MTSSTSSPPQWASAARGSPRPSTWPAWRSRSIRAARAGKLEEAIYLPDLAPPPMWVAHTGLVAERVPRPSAGEGNDAISAAAPSATGPLPPAPVGCRRRDTLPSPGTAVSPSACPPAPGVTIYRLDRGMRIVVNGKQNGYLGVVMLDGSTGWIPALAAWVSRRTVSATALRRMLSHR